MLRLIISGLLILSGMVISASVHASRECLIPKLKIVSLEDKVVPLQMYLGKVVIVAFWTTWCSPCRNSELPGLIALRKQIPNADFHILAISNDAEKKEVQRYLGHPTIDFGVLEDNVFFDPNYETYHAIIGQNMAEVHPYAVIINKNGCIIKKVAGIHDWLSKPTVNLINRLLNNYD